MSLAEMNRWTEWDLNPRPLNSDQRHTHTHIYIIYTYIYIYIYIYNFHYIHAYIYNTYIYILTYTLYTLTRWQRIKQNLKLNWTFAIRKLFAFLIHVIIQKQWQIFFKMFRKWRNEYGCVNEVIWWVVLTLKMKSRSYRYDIKKS